MGQISFRTRFAPRGETPTTWTNREILRDRFSVAAAGPCAYFSPPHASHRSFSRVGAARAEGRKAGPGSLLDGLLSAPWLAIGRGAAGPRVHQAPCHGEDTVEQRAGG